MKCPWCKQEINNPEPMQHMIDCQRQEAKKWDADFRVKLTEMAVQRQQARA